MPSRTVRITGRSNTTRLPPTNWSVVAAPNNSSIRNNYIHHNTDGWLHGLYAHNSTRPSTATRFAYNGGTEGDGVDQRDVPQQFRPSQHRATASGTTATIRARSSKATAWRTTAAIGIFYEISATPSSGTTRSGGTRTPGCFISDVQEHADLQQHARKQFQGHHLLPQCALGGQARSASISRTIRRMTTRSPSARRAGRSRASSAICPTAPATQVAPYLNGSKNLTFSQQPYHGAIPMHGQILVLGTRQPQVLE